MEPSPTSSSQSPPTVAAPAKIFVGGITKEVEEDALKEYFEKYGEVKEVVVVKDRETGNAKGYGFIEFVDAEAAERAINEEAQHLIRDRAIEVKRARSRSEDRHHHQSTYHQSSIRSTNNTNNSNNNVTTTSRKIFVGGLPSNITEDEFRRYFETFGSVNDVVIMNDGETHRPRGFGFVTFDSAGAAQHTIQRRFHELNNKLVEVKMAVPKDNNNHQISGNRHGDMNNSSHVNHLPWGYYYYGYESQLVPGYGFGPFGYEGGCAYEGYAAIGCGAPMLAWNEHAMMMTVRQISVPYRHDAFYFYPGYVNTGTGGGYMRMAGGGYRRRLCKGKFNRAGGGDPHTKDLANDAE